MARIKLDKESLMEDFRNDVQNFSEEQLNELAEFFSRVYAKLYIKSQEDALDLLLNQGLPKAVKKLSREKQIEIKQRFLAM